jgi:hypothetical protein
MSLERHRSGAKGKTRQAGPRAPSSTLVEEPVAYHFAHLASCLLVRKWWFDPLGCQNSIDPRVGIVGGSRKELIRSPACNAVAVVGAKLVEGRFRA